MYSIGYFVKPLLLPATVVAGSSTCRKCACTLVTISFPVPPNALVVINLTFVNTVIDIDSVISVCELIVTILIAPETSLLMILFSRYTWNLRLVVDGNLKV